jgi:hypothetical protein
MKRLVITTACSVALLGAAAPAFADATPTPTPLPSISISMDQNTREVCTKSAATVTKGVSDFTAELGKVSAAAQTGDLAAAEKAVMNAGAVLVSLSGELRSDAQAANNPEVKTALEDVATEFQKLGTSLDGLTSLQNFNTDKLEQLADRMSLLCGGGSPSPSVTPSTSPS